MAFIYVDRISDGIQVKIVTYAQTKVKVFQARAAAEAYAESKLGKRTGCIISTLDMTPEQLADLAVREARGRALLKQMEEEGR